MPLSCLEDPEQLTDTCNDVWFELLTLVGVELLWYRKPTEPLVSQLQCHCLVLLTGLYGISLYPPRKLLCYHQDIWIPCLALWMMSIVTVCIGEPGLMLWRGTLFWGLESSLLHSLYRLGTSFVHDCNDQASKTVPWFVLRFFFLTKMSSHHSPIQLL